MNKKIYKLKKNIEQNLRIKKKLIKRLQFFYFLDVVMDVVMLVII